MYYDVVVVGGGLSGLCAAVSAAESGASVALVQDRAVLGGNSSSECGVPPHGAEALGHNRNLRDTGLLENIRIDFYCKYATQADTASYWDLLLRERCEKTRNLTLFLNHRMFAVHKEERNVTSIDITSMTGMETKTLEACVFVDATGDGNLAYVAGATFRWGREARNEFGEKLLGYDKADSCTLGSSIYGWAVKRDYPVSFTPPAWAVSYLSCADLAHRPHDIDHIIPRVTCSADHRELMFFWWLEWGGQLNVIDDADKIYRHLLAELFGIWDHLKNHCNEKTKKALANYELCRWSSFPMRRESRRFVGDYILSETDVAAGTVFPDAMGYGGWPMDDHPPMGIQSKEPACNQLFLSHPYTIPYRCCYSKDFDNLFLAGRCISVTHAALSSVRVMNTLGSLAEAVGVAACYCATHKMSVREAGKHIEEIRQEALRRDLYIPGVKESDSGNIAHSAHTFVSSEKTYARVSDAIGFMPLAYDTALQLPISTGTVDSLNIPLSAREDTELAFEIRRGRAVGYLGKEVLDSGSLPLRQGTGVYSLLSRPLSTGYGDILTIVLKKNLSVSWPYGKELYHTRWGVSFKGHLEGEAYHGASRIVLHGTDWIWVNDDGRLPGELARFFRGLPGSRRHEKLFITPHFEIFPVQKPYGAENLTNGVYRSAEWTNIWISGKGLPQNAELTWDSPVTVSRVEILFDTNLDYSDQRYGFPRGGDDYSIPAKIAETVSDYTLVLRNTSGKTVWETSVKGNRYRRNRVELPRPVGNVVSLRIGIEKTWGVEEARLFGVKVY